jgi:hypothetical protein
MPRRTRPATPRTPQEVEQNTAPPPMAPLSPHWAFVVQLREGTALTPEQLTGRAEHLVSGQARHFASLAELLAFIEQVLSPRGTTLAASSSSITAEESSAE